MYICETVKHVLIDPAEDLSPFHNWFGIQFPVQIVSIISRAKQK